MFLVQAIADFEPEMAVSSYSQHNAAQHEQNYQNKMHAPTAQEQNLRNSDEKRVDSGEQRKSLNTVQSQQEENQQTEEKYESKKRQRPEDHEQQLEEAEHEQQITYLSFRKGDKIVTRTTHENGWWFGNVLKHPDVHGYFPSNFVKVGTTAPPPEVPPEPTGKEDWMQEELKKLNGPVKSEYYQGITGYKMVKIDDKNKNILKGNYVKYDVASGLAKVPIKSQEPAAKAVRQMGYYFDYHQWCEDKNANPTPKSRPDPRKKRKKRLNLILFGEDKIKRTPKNQ